MASPFLACLALTDSWQLRKNRRHHAVVRMRRSQELNCSGCMASSTPVVVTNVGFIFNWPGNWVVSTTFLLAKCLVNYTGTLGHSTTPCCCIVMLLTDHGLQCLLGCLFRGHGATMLVSLHFAAQRSGCQHRP